jgi:DNA-3-methyladenine glycosylase II
MNEFTLEARGPFDFARSLEVMCHWQPVTRFAGGTRIAFNLDGDLTPVVVDLRAEKARLHGRVRGTSQIEVAAKQVARIFSLDHDASEYEAISDPKIRRLQRALPGLRPVCFFSPYEAAVWAILSQRISMAQAARLEQKLLDENGCLPPPDRLKLESLPEEKARRIRDLIDKIELLDAEKLRALGEVEGPASLMKIRGIGPFWSMGICLRAGGIRDVWPEEPRARQVMRKIGGNPEEWRPFRMWICFLLRVAEGRGLI